MEISRSTKKKYLFFYGAALALLVFLLKFLESRLLVINSRLEIYTGLVALIFTTLGIWLATRLIKPKVEKILIEKEVYIDPKIFTADKVQCEKLGISRRELDVLELMALGLSNQEIASRLFVSLNTIKTHSSKLFEKLDVKRRTQAVEKAKRLNIIS